jgi:hypothetical protein
VGWFKNWSGVVVSIVISAADLFGTDEIISTLPCRTSISVSLD